MLAGEDEQAFQPGGRSTFAPAGPVSTITNPDANIPTIQADPTPVKVRPPGFDDQRRGENLAIAAQTNVEDPRNVSTFPPSQEVPVDVNEPAPSVGTNRQQQQQESLQDYNPSLEMVTGMPGSQNNFPGVGTFDPLQVDSRQVSPSVNRDFLFEPAVKQKTLEEQLFEIIQQAGNA